MREEEGGKGREREVEGGRGRERQGEAGRGRERQGEDGERGKEGGAGVPADVSEREGRKERESEIDRFHRAPLLSNQPLEGDSFHSAAAGGLFARTSGRDRGWNPWQWIRIVPESLRWTVSKKVLVTANATSHGISDGNTGVL